MFFDSRSLAVGKVFDDPLITAVRHCAVLLAVIGRQWTTMTDDHGTRLIDRRSDWVRKEIAEALRRKVPVIPILLEDTEELARTRLPASLRDLARHQFIRLRHRSFESDFWYLTTQLARLCPDLPELRA